MVAMYAIMMPSDTALGQPRRRPRVGELFKLASIRSLMPFTSWPAPLPLFVSLPPSPPLARPPPLCPPPTPELLPPPFLDSGRRSSLSGRPLAFPPWSSSAPSASACSASFFSGMSLFSFQSIKTDCSSHGTSMCSSCPADTTSSTCDMSQVAPRIASVMATIFQRRMAATCAVYAACAAWVAFALRCRCTGGGAGRGSGARSSACNSRRERSRHRKAMAIQLVL
mmetsp:Transcript_9757/g.40210  ORF Transcript_9757/g.40210 Transcript_9757/m.40210 type:complete len:225 (-) Transcript_9757:579-1253(-)